MPKKNRIPNELDVALGARIKQVRLSQRPRVPLLWVAREIGCTVAQLQKYESGENRVSWSRLCEIAKALDTDLIELIRPVIPPRF